VERIEQDHQLVLNTLRNAGLHIEDIHEFVNGSTPAEAVPLLIELLPLLDDNAIKEGVVRALGDKVARGAAARPLMAELRRLRSTMPMLRWTIANSLVEVVEPSDFDEIRSFVGDESLGKAREMLVVALAKTNHPNAVTELARLTHDEALAGHIVMAVGDLRAAQMRPFVEQQLNSDKAWVRKEAKKALRRL
jgi:HEAT repeat protein